MIRLLAAPAAVPVAAAVLLSTSAVAHAEPEPTDAVYAIGMCFDPANPLPQRPAVFDYNCDDTGVLHDMVWSTWDDQGASGFGTDISVECQPNCAEGARLTNPVVVHAWNPQPSSSPSCPANARFYADVTIAYPHTVPPWIQPGTEWYPGNRFCPCRRRTRGALLRAQFVL
ncbi:hypothetical protein [Mycobacterium sp. C31M]